ncbi:MAG: VanZ family protein [Bacteroidaceae bacterium]|nr:VanZ family protein [Bacteroidaceae bacterium]
MMKYIIKRYPLSCMCICIVWVLSLVPVFPETPLDNISFIDKWTHLAMYGGTSAIIWWEYLRHHMKSAHHPTTKMVYKRIILYAVIAPIVMGGVLELLQRYCTGGRRSGEWLDFIADSVGVLLVFPFAMFLAKKIASKH